MHEEIKEAGEKFKPLYFVIAEGIVRDIEDGNYKTGDHYISELQRQKRGLAMNRQRRTDRYLRAVYHPGWWKTEPLGWEREELYYRTLYNNW